jgi:heme/copper-type cytochrome/quinol oxidase subunit 4
VHQPQQQQQLKHQNALMVHHIGLTLTVALTVLKINFAVKMEQKMNFVVLDLT